MLVRDLSGRPLFYLDGDSARDVNGKPVATRAEDAKNLSLADRAAHWMGGRQVNMDLGPGDVAYPATQAAFPIPAGECIADRVSEVRMVSRDRGFWYLQNVADATQLVIANGDSDGAPPELNPGFTKTQFTTTGYALAARLPRHILDNADFDLECATLYRLVEGLRLAREYRVAQLLTTTANWPAANQVAVGVNKWNGGTTPNPIANLFSALGASALPAHTLILAESTAQYFFNNANTQTYVQAGGELPHVCFARAKFQSAGAAAYVWAPALPTNVALVRTHDVLPTSVTLRWNGDAPDGEQKDGILVRKYWDPQSDCFWLVCAHNDVEIMVSNQIGAVMTGAVA